MTRFAGNCIFMHAGINGIQRLTASGEIEADHCTGDGWKNLVTTNLKAFNVASIAHLETYNNIGAGYQSIGTRSVNGTCNNGQVFGILRAENNTGDGIKITNDCDISVMKSEAEGSTGVGTFGLNVDVNSQQIFFFDHDGAGGVAGPLNFLCNANCYLVGPAQGTPRFHTLIVNVAETINATVFASLPADPNGTLRYCSDCTIASPCAGAGTGALAKRINGAWVCN